MMETKLLAALCALLLINFGSADHDANVTPSSASKSAPAAPAAESVPTSIPDHVSHAATTPSPNGTDTSSGVTGSLSNDTSTEGKSIPELPQPKKDNNTDVVSPAEAAGAEKNQTNSTASQPPSPPSGSPTPTSHNPLKSTTISPSPSAHPAPVDTISTTVTPTNTSHHAAVPLPDSTTASAPPTSAPTPEPPKHQTTTTTATTQSSSTSSTSSSQEVPNSELTTLTPQNTSEPIGHPGTSSEGHQTTTTVASPSSSTAQTKAHADTPSQLNVGGDTTMVHDSPTLDPLLAGLVSAFIITAVIITLLLFLKLRRRDNRPEFRRLQDLPMDDMMEDTPLSMYSY